MTGPSVLCAYRLVFVALILFASVRAAMTEERHALFIAAVEIVGALLLLRRRSQLVGAGVLLAVFAIVEALHIAQGQWPTYLAQYAASTIFIVLLDRTVQAAA